MPDPTPATTTTTDATSTAPDAGASTVTTTTTVKPGVKTSEFAISVFVAFLGAFMQSGLVADGSPTMRIAGMIMTALATLGYVASRALVKSAAHKANASVSEGKVAAMIATHHAVVMKQAFDSMLASKAAQPAAAP